MIVDINNSNFEKEVLNEKGFVIVDFFGTWCMPCKFLMPILHKIEEDKKIKLAKVDIDENEDFENDTATVGGWTVTMLDGEVNEGDTFKYENLEITVLKTDGFRVERIGICELPIEEEE